MPAAKRTLLTSSLEARSRPSAADSCRARSLMTVASCRTSAWRLLTSNCSDRTRASSCALCSFRLATSASALVSFAFWSTKSCLQCPFLSNSASSVGVMCVTTLTAANSCCVVGIGNGSPVVANSRASWLCAALARAISTSCRRCKRLLSSSAADAACWACMGFRDSVSSSITFSYPLQGLVIVSSVGCIVSPRPCPFPALRCRHFVYLWHSSTTDLLCYTFHVSPPCSSTLRCTCPSLTLYIHSQYHFPLVLGTTCC